MVLTTPTKELRQQGVARGSVFVAEIIDRRPVSHLQWTVFILCGLAVFVEGFDTQAIGYVAPAIGKAWNLPPGALGPIFSAGLTGLALGSFFLAPLADKIGRKPLIVGSTIAFGLLTVATGLCENLNTLFFVRLLTGFGIGAAMPNAITLTADYTPDRHRATAVVLLMCGFGLGSATGGAVAAQLLIRSTWPFVFFAGGIISLLLVPFLLFLLPESLRFLALSPGDEPKLKRMVSRLDPAIDTSLLHVASRSEKIPAVRIRDLFADGRRRVTILLWIAFFMNLLDLYLLANWLPTAIYDAGLSVSVAALATAMLQIGGIVASFALGPLLDRYGAVRILPMVYILGAFCIALIGFAGASVAFTVAAVFGAGFAVVGSQNCNNGVATKIYPTEMRASGVGWANAVGRVGSIVGPALGGIMLGMHANIRTIMIASALPALIAAMAYLSMPRALAEEPQIGPAVRLVD